MKKKIFFVSSSIQFYENFLLKTLSSLNNNYEIYVCTDLRMQTIEFSKIELINLDISRKISLIKDISSIFRLLKILRRINPDVIISSSPKGLLILAITTLFYRCRRFHILTGIIWSGKINIIKKLIYKYLDLFFLYSCEEIFVDSPSQILFLKKENFYYKKLSLIHEGSIQGVDLNKFKIAKSKLNLRNKFGFSNDLILLIFLGRVSPEKGIYYFMNLIKKLRKNNKNIKGLIVGRDEKNIISQYKKNYSSFYNDFLYFPYTNEPEKYIQSSDIMIIPSEREGFCQAAIEGSACGIPLIGFNVIGLQDSIVNDTSGYLVPFGDQKSLEERAKFLINNPQIRKELGQQGRIIVNEKYDQSKVVKCFVNQIVLAIDE